MLPDHEAAKAAKVDFDWQTAIQGNRTQSRHQLLWWRL